MASKNFKNAEYLRVENLIKTTSIFNTDKGGGVFRKKAYPFILQNADNNLFANSIDDINNYFRNNRVAWWGGRCVTNHTLSSQVACLNHLFPIRDDKSAVLSLIQLIEPEIEDVLLIDSDEYMPAYIQFEAVSDSTDHLNELNSTRGSNCTSVDALIYGLRKDGKKILFPIEWKYVETYSNENKAAGRKGEIRKGRYTELINQSEQLNDNSQDIYYFEPFYQLMRQTLWAEQMIHHKDSETTKGDDYIHVHVIPYENKNLLNKTYPCSGKEMEDTWRSCLKSQSKYIIVSPKELLGPINKGKYDELFEYLEKRYW